MAENLFSIEDAFSETEEVTNTLFSDDDPDKLEEIKKQEEEKKKKEEKEKEEKLKADAAAKAAAAKKVVPNKQQNTPTKEEDEVVENVEDHLFGEGDDDNDDNPPKTTDDDDDSSGDENLNQFEVLSKELYTLGVFNPEFDEDGQEVPVIAKSGQEFKELFESQIQTGMYAMLENHLSRFGEDRLQLFDAIFTKGVDPKQYLPTYNQVQDLKSLSLDDESAQELVVREFYKRAGLSDEKVNAKIQRLKDTAELQGDAEEFHPQLVAQDEAKLKKQEEDRENEIKMEEQRDASYKASIVKILSEKIKAKDFDGISVNDKVARETFDFLYNKKWKGADGKKFTDFDKFILELNKPENHALKVKVGLLAKQNFDLSKVQKKAVSEESSELFKELAQKKKKAKVATAASGGSAWNL